MKEEVIEAMTTLMADLKVFYPMFTNQEFLDLMGDSVDEFASRLDTFEMDECLN